MSDHNYLHPFQYYIPTDVIRQIFDYFDRYYVILSFVSKSFNYWHKTVSSNNYFDILYTNYPLWTFHYGNYDISSLETLPYLIAKLNPTKNMYIIKRANNGIRVRILRILADNGTVLLQEYYITSHYQISKYNHLLKRPPGIKKCSQMIMGSCLNLHEHIVNDDNINVLCCLKEILPKFMEIHAYEILLKANQKCALKILKMIYDNGQLKLEVSLFWNAIRKQRMDAIEWLFEIYYPCDFIVFDKVLAFCNNIMKVKIIDYIGHWRKQDSEYAYQAVIIRNDFQLMKKLYNHGCQLTDQIFIFAIKHNKDVINWLIKKGCPITEDVFEAALNYGPLDIIFQLIALGCPHYPDVLKGNKLKRYNDEEKQLIINYVNNE